jgi:hypothetical protein
VCFQNKSQLHFSPSSLLHLPPSVKAIIIATRSVPTVKGGKSTHCPQLQLLPLPLVRFICMYSDAFKL